MKRLLLALAASLATMSVAVAADMPIRKAQVIDPAYDAWTGLYFGAQGGYGNVTVKNGSKTVFDQSDWFGGGHLGYNYRVSSGLVFGLETDAMLGGYTELGWIGSTRLRGGYLLSENLLAYITGGVVYGRLDSTLKDVSFTGWTAGGGLEYNLTRHVSVRTEYRYIDAMIASPLPHGIAHVGLGGLTYKF